MMYTVVHYVWCVANVVLGAVTTVSWPTRRGYLASMCPVRVRSLISSKVSLADGKRLKKLY